MAETFERSTASPRFILVSYDQNSLEQTASDDLDQVLASVKDDRISWLTVNGLSRADGPLLQKILPFFRISSNLSETILSEELDEFDGERTDCLYLDYEIFKGYSAVSGFDRVRGALVLAKNCLLLFDKDDSGYFDGERRKILKRETRVNEFPVDYLFYLLVRNAITEIQKLLFVDLTQHFEDLEDRVIAYPGADFILDEIMLLRTQIRPLYDTVLRFSWLNSFILEEESLFISAHTRTYFEKNLESDRQELWSGYREVRNWTVQLMDIHRANMDEKRNDIVKVLTLVSFIFLPITFIASLYGMNFRHMPELGWRYSYYVVLLIMALIVLSLIIFIKKKRWL